MCEIKVPFSGTRIVTLKIAWGGGDWVAQSAERLTSAQVMISRVWVQALHRALY